ncbi:hypothetical protein ATANTOWER_011840 [Ataeniobius toweri]|uniref:Uncharacterized protein n=1 Tax=Ataeniobius toweri TaxID=208326 RepID=A0ABU7BMQ3_9TELE|nr:hypothetical protein [Ataeniobius toweri]
MIPEGFLQVSFSSSVLSALLEKQLLSASPVCSNSSLNPCPPLSSVTPSLLDHCCRLLHTSSDTPPPFAGRPNLLTLSLQCSQQLPPSRGDCFERSPLSFPPPWLAQSILYGFIYLPSAFSSSPPYEAEMLTTCMLDKLQQL